MKHVLRSFALVVCLPTLIAAIYFGMIASDSYESEARFAVRSSKTNVSSGLASLLTSSSVISSGGQDSQIVMDYIKSQDMLTTLDEELDLVGHYSDPSIDYLSRLESNSTKEELLRHFLKQITLIEDSGGSNIKLVVNAFSREYARKVALSIIALSENLVNDLSRRIEDDSLERAKSEVELAAEKVRLASENLAQFRTVNTSINPAEETVALLGLLSAIEAKLSTARIELSEKRAFMKENSPVIKSLKNKVVALENQLTLDRSRIIDGDGYGNGASDLINDYQPLALVVEMAQQQYASALGSLELARIEAERKKRYLVTFVNPVLPEESTQPRRIVKTLTVFVYAFLFFAIGGLMWSALREHIGH